MLLSGIFVLSVALAVLLYLSCGWWWVLILGFIGGFLLLAGLVFLFFWGTCQLIDTTKPQQKDSMFYRYMTYLCVDAALQALRVKICCSGMEKVPKNGRFLLVCNHTSNLDPAFLLSAFKKNQLAFISKRENKDMFIVGKLMHKLMCQLVNRENDREALKTILKCIQLIKDDEVSIAVFPEGYIHEDRKLHTFRHGVFKIAQKAKVPVVVCTMKDTHYIMDKVSQLKSARVELNVLSVISAEEVAEVSTVDLGNRIYEMMAADLGPERVAQEENT